MSKNPVTPEDFQAYLDRGYVPTPIGELAKGQGKRPLVENYLELDMGDDPMETVYNWFETLGDKITGLGVILGPRSQNLCCIDIDTEDEEIIEKIVKYFHSPFN